VADEPEEKPAGERETAVGHPVVDADAATESKPAETTEVFFSRDEPAPQPAAAPQTGTTGTSPAAADRQASDDKNPFDEKPELYIGGAFVGAFVFAKLLKKITGGGD
jgi:hypothetical protein